MVKGVGGAAARKPKQQPKGAAEAAPGHNSSKAAMSEAQETALYVNRLRIIEKAKEALAEAQADVVDAYKVAKLEEGFSKRVIDLGLDLRKNGLDKHEEKLRELKMAARRLNMGLQADLFGEDIDRSTAVEKAKADGFLAGCEGFDPKPPFDTSLPQYQAFLQGWHEGQATIREALGNLKKPKPVKIDDSEFERQPAAGSA